MELNEGKACDAILRHIEVREGALRSHIKCLDGAPPNAQVELVCTIGSRRYAIEHTGIVPFDQFIKFNNNRNDWSELINKELAADLPEGDAYRLIIPYNVDFAKTDRKAPHIRKSLIAWIKSFALTLPRHSASELMEFANPITIPNVPFPVKLIRLAKHSGHDNSQRLQIIRAVDEEGKTQLTQSITKACDRKFNKLHWWKNERQAKTILLLENPDIQISNSSDIAASFLSIAKDRSNRPDETYLIDTFDNAIWYLWPLLINEQSYFELGRERHPLCWTTDANSLEPVTGR